MKLFRSLILITLAFVSAIWFSSGCGVAAEIGLDILFYDPDINVEPTELSFEAVEGDTEPQSQDVDAECTAYDIDYGRSRCTAYVSTDQTWLTTDPTDFWGYETITVTVDPSVLEVGTHEGVVSVRAEALIFEGGENANVTLEILEADEEKLDSIEEDIDVEESVEDEYHSAFSNTFAVINGR